MVPMAMSAVACFNFSPSFAICVRLYTLTINVQSDLVLSCIVPPYLRHSVRIDMTRMSFICFSFILLNMDWKKQYKNANKLLNSHRKKKFVLCNKLHKTNIGL